MALHWDEVDGVPVVWAQGQQPLGASLMFRVGVRDESMATCGITHLIEHLAMSTLGRRRYDHNASVDLTFTDFTVSGRPAVVVDHMAEVCAGLRALPMERLATEAKVLKAENSPAADPVALAHLRRRFGLRGLGIADVQPPALGHLTAAHVSAFAERFFTRQNAVLALTGPPPDGLRLELPEGTRQTPPANPPLPLPTPMWFELDDEGFGLSFDLDGEEPFAREAAQTGLRIALDRAQDELRQRHGWLYHVDFDIFHTEERCPVVFTADPPTAHADDVRKGLTAILRDLHSTGPTDTELAEDLAAVQDYLSHPDSPNGEVGAAASSLLLNRQAISAEERLRLRKDVTAPDCSAALKRLEDTLLVAMPPETKPSDPDLHPEPQCSSTRASGKPLRRTVSGLIQTPRRTRFVVGDDGLSLETPDGPQTILWGDVVGVAEDSELELITVIGVDAVMIPFAARWFHDGKKAMAQIDAQVDARLRFQPDDEEEPTRFDRWMASLEEWVEKHDPKNVPASDRHGD